MTSHTCMTSNTKQMNFKDLFNGNHAVWLRRKLYDLIDRIKMCVILLTVGNFGVADDGRIFSGT